MKILEILTEKRRLGNRGERAAARYLWYHGYRILERNFVRHGAEIDLIAQKRDTVVFVEVKTRVREHQNPREPRPASAVTPQKQRKIIAAAQCYTPAMQRGLRYRFDIIEVYFSANPTFKARQIVHIPGAFNKNSAQNR